jgi:hypothetical protein
VANKATKYWLAFLTALILAGGVFLLRPSPDPVRITKATFDRIKDGMSPNEVNTIIGVPPDDYLSGPHIYHSDNPDWEEGFFQEETAVTWLTDEGQLIVNFGDFDGPGGVSGKAYWSTTRKRQGMIDDLIWRLKRKWYRWFP